MRAIINIVSERVARAAGWKARPVEISYKATATLAQILKAADLSDRSTLYDHLVEKGRLKSGYDLYVNGLIVPVSSSLQKKVRDNSQIYILDQVAVRK